MSADKNKAYFDRIRERVRLLRETSGLTQQQVAERSGVPYNYYCFFEQGSQESIRVDYLMQIANSYGMEPNEILYEHVIDPAQAETLDSVIKALLNLTPEELQVHLELIHFHNHYKDKHGKNK